MHGLILAGGEGSRLAASGVSVPKALVPLGGTPQLVRLVRTFGRLGCTSVTCLLREGVPSDLATAEAHAFAIPIRVRSCRTPSSLHTLIEGLGAIEPGPVFCTMVDTVMPDPDWRRVHRESTRLLAAGADAVLVVTPYVDDERPLYVHLDAGGRVRAVTDAPSDRVLVTGGVYAFGPRARAEAGRALALGRARMRGFLQAVVGGGSNVVAVEVPRIIDLDHRRDLEAASSWQEFCEDEGFASA